MREQAENNSPFPCIVLGENGNHPLHWAQDGTMDDNWSGFVIPILPVRHSRWKNIKDSCEIGQDVSKLKIIIGLSYSLFFCIICLKSNFHYICKAQFLTKEVQCFKWQNNWTMFHH